MTSIPATVHRLETAGMAAGSGALAGGLALLIGTMAGIPLLAGLAIGGMAAGGGAWLVTRLARASSPTNDQPRQTEGKLAAALDAAATTRDELAAALDAVAAARAAVSEVDLSAVSKEDLVRYILTNDERVNLTLLPAVSVDVYGPNAKAVLDTDSDTPVPGTRGSKRGASVRAEEEYSSCEAWLRILQLTSTSDMDEYQRALKTTLALRSQTQDGPVLNTARETLADLHALLLDGGERRELRNAIYVALGSNESPVQMLDNARRAIVAFEGHGSIQTVELPALRGEHFTEPSKAQRPTRSKQSRLKD